MLGKDGIGGGGGVGAWIVRPALADFVPLPVPVRVRVLAPAGVDVVVVTVKVATAEPFAGTLTRDGRE